jgi:hypothetical protein
MYPVINVQSMRCIEQCSARKTYPKLGLDTLCPIDETPASLISVVGGGGIVGPLVGWLDSSAKLHPARELFLDQKTKDAVHMACVITPTDLPPTPVQVIKINY